MRENVPSKMFHRKRTTQFSDMNTHAHFKLTSKTTFNCSRDIGDITITAVEEKETSCNKSLIPTVCLYIHSLTVQRLSPT